MAGRFAPSPTGALHLGNLRTAAIAWLAARHDGLDYIVRMEDLDRAQASLEYERSQLDDLVAIGLDWDGEIIRQSERFDRYHAAIDDLTERGLTYECFCSRRQVRAEIEAAPAAPHLPPGSYPGTCRDLSDERRRRLLDEGRRPALRLRAPDDGRIVSLIDLVAGPFEGGIDDTVLRRNDGVPSYNVAVVLDDAAQGVTQVVRGDDLLPSTPRQIHLQQLFGLPTPAYGHVPLVFGDDGERLAKRHGAVTLTDLADSLGGQRAATDAVVRWIVESLHGATAQRGEAAADAVSASQAATSERDPSIATLIDDFDLGALASPPIVAPPWSRAAT